MTVQRTYVASAVAVLLAIGGSLLLARCTGQRGYFQILNTIYDGADTWQATDTNASFTYKPDSTTSNTVTNTLKPNVALGQIATNYARAARKAGTITEPELHQVTQACAYLASIGDGQHKFVVTNPSKIDYTGSVGGYPIWNFPDPGELGDSIAVNVIQAWQLAKEGTTNASASDADKKQLWQYCIDRLTHGH